MVPVWCGGNGLCKKAWLSLHILVMGDRVAEKMTLWQRSQEEAGSHARGRDGGMDKQMLLITQGCWGLDCVWAFVCTFCLCARVEVPHNCVHASLLVYPCVCTRCCECIPSACTREWIFQQPQSAWGTATYKRHLARRAKTTKVTLPLVMYSVLGHCSAGERNVPCVRVSFHGVPLSPFSCHWASAVSEVMKRCIWPWKLLHCHCHVIICILFKQYECVLFKRYVKVI